MRRSIIERGPLRVDFAARKVHGQGREVALSGREIYKMLPAPVGAAAPELVACFARGTWRSLLLGLSPDLRPPEPGWWRLYGRLTGEGIAWLLAGRLPGGCD